MKNNNLDLLFKDALIFLDKAEDSIRATRREIIEKEVEILRKIEEKEKALISEGIKELQCEEIRSRKEK